MSKSLDDLDPIFKARVAMFTATLDKEGIRYTISETRRSYIEQREAFRKGHSKRDGLKLISMHQAGLAVDVVPLNSRGEPTWDYIAFADAYKKIAKIGRDMGLECGADWTPLDPATGLGWDPPHYEMKG